MTWNETNKNTAIYGEKSKNPSSYTDVGQRPKANLRLAIADGFYLNIGGAKLIIESGVVWNNETKN